MSFSNKTRCLLWAIAGAVALPLVPLFGIVGYIAIEGGVRAEIFILPLIVALAISPVRAIGAYLTYLIPKLYGGISCSTKMHVVWGSVIISFVDVLWIMLLFEWFVGMPIESWIYLPSVFLAPPSAAWVAWQSRRSREEGLPFWPQYSLLGLVLIVLYLGGVMGVILGR